MQGTSGVTSTDKLAAALSSPRQLRLQLSPSTVLRNDHEVGCADGMLVWRVLTTGTDVNSGTIVLPDAGILLLTGHGANFHDTTFTGTLFPQFLALKSQSDLIGKLIHAIQL